MLTSTQISSYNKNGYLVVKDFLSDTQRKLLMDRAESLIDDFDPSSSHSIFTTNEQERSSDDYFLSSGDQIRFFFEEKAIDSNGNFTVPKHKSINKIGHAQHELDPIYKKVINSLDIPEIGKQLGIQKPRKLQSMHIFKQPNIGGEVGLHQDSTFLITEPESTVGFWFALEDANKDNGCLQVASGGHKGPLRKLFKRENNQMKMEELSNEPFPETDTFVEVKKGTLVLLHGRLPHYSCENKSLNSRHAYTIHAIDGKSKYLDYNWLQRPDLKLNGFKNA